MNTKQETGKAAQQISQQNKRFVRRCFNCRHASKSFKLHSGTHHHCYHPERLAGIENPSAWDSLVEWHSTCKKWEPEQEGGAA